MSNNSALDVAARSIDLTKALIEASSSSNRVINLAIELGHWLGREKLNRYELEDFMQRAKGLVMPNVKAEVFFKEILEGEQTHPIANLSLRNSGSLGRLMVRDPWLSWIVSTTSCLFQFHRADYVSDALCMILVHASVPSEKVLASTELQRHPNRIQLRSVADKLVSSVWFNVVNSGSSSVPLPQELEDVCRRGHHLGSSALASLIHALQRCGQRVIVRSGHLLRDLALWLTLHFEGQLQVTVNSKIIYKVQLGESSREIELRVSMFCAGERDVRCHETRFGTYELLDDVSNGYKELLSGRYGQENITDNQPAARQKLYTIIQSIPEEHRLRCHTLQIAVKSVAQEIVRWLLGIRIVSRRGSPFLGFTVAFSADTDDAKNTIRVSNIFAKIPGILNLRWGEKPPGIGKLVYAADLPDCRFEDEKSYPGLSQDQENKQRVLEDILRQFPILRDLMDEAKPFCLCPPCRAQSYSPVISLVRRVGCVRTMAFEEVLILVAHAIADGFGAPDISAVMDSTSIIEGMLCLLQQLCDEQQILWDTWFSVAASVFLGCPFQRRVMDVKDGGTTSAAVQYGNLAAIAPWLDLSQELVIEGSFKLIPGKGRLGVASSNADGREQFRSVEDEYAVIQTERTEDTQSLLEQFKKKFKPPGTASILEEDLSIPKLDFILVSAKENVYRLLLRVQSRNYSRIIDPSDAIRRVTWSIPTPPCKHVHLEALPSLTKPAGIYSFDEVLGLWNEEDTSEEDRQAVLHITHKLTAHCQRNIALALSVGNIAAIGKGSCFDCMLKAAEAAPNPPDRREALLDRYIIMSEADQPLTVARRT